MGRRTRRLKQAVRRVPGVLPARRRILRGARNSQRMRHIVKKVFALDTSSAVPMDVASGRVVGGIGTETLPVVLVVVLGAGEASVEAVVDETARLQLLGAGFRPVVVTDVAAFDTTRRYGYPAELLIARQAWDDGQSAADGYQTWDDYARDRIALLFDTYRATASVTVGPNGLDDASRLVLSSLHP